MACLAAGLLFDGEDELLLRACAVEEERRSRVAALANLASAFATEASKRAPRARVRRPALTGIAQSAWRKLLESGNTDSFVVLMGVTSDMFQELLEEVRVLYCCRVVPQ
jgi:hypothetical protein